MELTIVTGTIAHYRNMDLANCSAAEASGKRLAGDRLPLDGNPHLIQVAVPRPGLYFLEVDDSMAGWQIKVTSGRHASIVVDPARKVEHAGWMQPMHFFVPKGTRELHYYWYGQPHRIHCPDGKVLQEVKTKGELVKVLVPEGADGKTWHLSQVMLGTLWFFNAPHYLASSPAALLVPRELAEKDGLPKVRKAAQ